MGWGDEEVVCLGDSQVFYRGVIRNTMDRIVLASARRYSLVCNGA